jgi:hypothetical protein
MGRWGGRCREGRGVAGDRSSGDRRREEGVAGVTEFKPLLYQISLRFVLETERKSSNATELKKVIHLDQDEG